MKWGVVTLQWTSIPSRGEGGGRGGEEGGGKREGERGREGVVILLVASCYIETGISSSYVGKRFPHVVKYPEAF